MTHHLALQAQPGWCRWRHAAAHAEQRWARGRARAHCCELIALHSLPVCRHISCGISWAHHYRLAGAAAARCAAACTQRLGGCRQLAKRRLSHVCTSCEPSQPRKSFGRAASQVREGARAPPALLGLLRVSPSCASAARLIRAPSSVLRKPPHPPPPPPAAPCTEGARVPSPAPPRALHSNIMPLSARLGPRVSPSRRGVLLAAPLLALPHLPPQPAQAAAASAAPILDQPMRR